MKQCSGANCPMQIGYHVEKCTFGEDCPNYTEENIESMVAAWALIGIQIAADYDISANTLADYFKAAVSMQNLFKNIKKGEEQ